MLKKFIFFLHCSLNFLPCYAKDLNLWIPGEKPETLDQITVNVKEKNQKSLRVFYQGELFDGEEGKVLMHSLQKLMNSSYRHYKDVYATGELANCKEPSKTPSLTLIFLEEVGSENKSSRKVYFHPKNPGPLIESASWKMDAVKDNIAHEAVHAWCQHNEQTRLLDWREEGAADYVSYATTQSIPRYDLHRYFSDPCRDSLYGSSLIWWIARMESGNFEQFLKTLASLHLGLRQDFFHEELKSDVVCSKNELPYGRSSTKASSSQQEIAFFRTEWDTIKFEKPKGKAQVEYFIWDGPVPAKF